MGHGMTQNDKMYSVRVAPWHMGMGTNVLILDESPETRLDRMVASGQDFTITERKVYMELEDNGEELSVDEVEGWKALTRSDNNHILHVARSSYTVVQNVVGHEIFEALSKGARLDDGTGGTIRDGAVCYLSARVDEESFVEGDDSPVYPYVVVTWAHDGTGSFQARRTTVRVVCWNTLNLSEMMAKRSGLNFSFTHKGNILDRIEEAKAVISGAREETKAFIELGNELAKMPLSNTQREQFITEFIPMPEATIAISDRVMDNILDARNKLRSVFNGKTIPDVHRYTAYGAVQAGLEYLDHLRGYRDHATYLGRTLLRDEPLKKKLIPMVKEIAKW